MKLIEATLLWKKYLDYTNSLIHLAAKFNDGSFVTPDEEIKILGQVVKAKREELTNIFALLTGYKPILKTVDENNYYEEWQWQAWELKNV